MFVLVFEVFIISIYWTWIEISCSSFVITRDSWQFERIIILQAPLCTSAPTSNNACKLQALQMNTEYHIPMGHVNHIPIMQYGQALSEVLSKNPVCQLSLTEYVSSHGKPKILHCGILYRCIFFILRFIHDNKIQIYIFGLLCFEV